MPDSKQLRHVGMGTLTHDTDLVVQGRDNVFVWFDAQRRQERSQRIEKVGAELRALMPFLHPVVITDEETVGSARQQLSAVRGTRRRIDACGAAGEGADRAREGLSGRR